MLSVRGVLIVWPPLVIEIVHQRGDSPEIFVRAKFARVRANARFHRQHMLAQTFRTRIFTKQFPCIFTRGHSVPLLKAKQHTEKPEHALAVRLSRQKIEYQFRLAQNLAMQKIDQLQLKSASI